MSVSPRPSSGETARSSSAPNRRAAALVVPAAVFFALFLVVPTAFLIRVSLLPPGPAAALEGGTTLDAYRALADPYLFGLAVRTTRLAALTTLGCLLIGYPLAWSYVRARGLWRRVQMLIIISPLFLSVVVRAYSWLLLAGRQGLVNTVAAQAGLGRPWVFLNTEYGVVVAMIEALVPFMVLSLAAVMSRIDAELIDAARALGASPLSAFLRIVLPLSIPGAMAGSTLVFLVAMGAYATPAMIGGARFRVVVTEIYTQITTVFNWPLGAALAIGLLLFCFLSSLVADRIERRLSRWAP